MLSKVNEAIISATARAALTAPLRDVLHTAFGVDNIVFRIGALIALNARKPTEMATQEDMGEMPYPC
jgi:hypothetical protein